MKYLFCILIPIGLSVLIISIKHIVRFANAKMLYEMSCTSREGIFTLITQGKYGIWLSGKQFIKSPIGELGIKLINQQTGKNIPLSAKLLRTSVNGFETGRIELYSFWAEEGIYVISLDGEGSAGDKVGSFVINAINKHPVDYSQFSIQIRKHIPVMVLVLCILGIILGFMAMGLGIVFSIVL